MRILALCKRQYTQRDLLDDRFGRLRELPLALARRGHEVRGLCLSYHNRPEGELTDRNPDDQIAGVRWQSLNAGVLKLPGLLRFARHARFTAKQFRPDVVLSASDSIYGIVGDRIARASGARHVFDLYDNFEAFATMRLPGVRSSFVDVIRRAAGITCVSEALVAKVRDDYGRMDPVQLIPNGVDRTLFHPRDRESCRQRLGLPAGARIVGIVGAISRTRDIDTVLRAMSTLMHARDKVHLLLAGPRDRGLALPSGPRVHDLGIRPYSEVPDLLSALDVAVVGNLDSRFGRYCFPQKAYETIACGVPLVASDIGAMHHLMNPCPVARFRPGDADDLVRALGEQLDHACRLPVTDAPDWNQLGEQLDRFLRQTAHGPR